MGQATSGPGNRARGARRLRKAAEEVAGSRPPPAPARTSKAALTRRTREFMKATGLDQLEKTKKPAVTTMVCGALQLADIRDHLYHAILEGRAERREASAMVSAHKQQLATFERLGLPGDIDLDGGSL